MRCFVEVLRVERDTEANGHPWPKLNIVCQRSDAAVVDLGLAYLSAKDIMRGERGTMYLCKGCGIQAIFTSQLHTNIVATL